MTQPDSMPLEIPVQEVKRLLDDEADFLLLDCREQNEFDFVRIAGSRLIPMSQIQQRVGELDDHRDKHVVVHCHHGGRSREVTMWMRGLGFGRVQNMTGGIDEWSTAIDRALPRY